MKKILTIMIAFILISNTSKAENYVFGGGKLFNYGITTSDLQNINTSLVSLGFSSSTSKTDNTGIGFDLGLGFGITDAFAIEAGYVNYGTLEINTNTTGPVENIKTEITGNGLTLAGKFDLADSGVFVKGGIHSWDLSGKVSTSLGSSSEALGSGEDPYFSFGYRTPGSSSGFTFSFDYYAIDDGDISSLTLGYSSVF